MSFRKIFLVLLMVLICGCTWPKPYIAEHNSLMRKSPHGTKDLAPPKKITVCYNINGTSPESVNQLARERCSSFGKKLAFFKQSRSDCPLLTPMGAIYECIDQE